MGVLGTPVGLAEHDGMRLGSERDAHPRHGNKDSALKRLLAAGDAFAVVLALNIALVIPEVPAAGHRIVWALPVVPLMMILFKLYGLYD
ncbi:MAG: hypothetical protein ACTHQQ_06050, partial [Solirubrobacteraceae bacterium]